ncbi:unnamed protein product [Nippostrongylus brasiliensis]|uniref:Uncharacterized protein n=1 Tax=Nippostrongylus brasiliensis TaxID=27835 RepID=A0A0N4XUY6_NIPBR|nr:unnamed protein product [Nippostrongylus brasiliensis]
MMIRLLLVFGFAAVIQTQIVPDCDTEFASLVIDLLQSEIDDPFKLSRIEAILSSCNKSKMQKMAEISVFLFGKGTPQGETMENIRRIDNTLKDEREKRLEQSRASIPKQLEKVFDIASGISMNGSLSGNEKVFSLSRAITNVPRKHRKEFERIFNEEADPSRNKSPSSVNTNTNMVPLPKGEPIKAITTMNNIDYKMEAQKSFPIEKDSETNSENGLSASESIPPSSIIRQNDTPQPSDARDQLFHARSVREPVRMGNPSVTYDYNGGGRLIDEMTKPIIATHGRPQSVGIGGSSSHSGMDDIDLLNSRNSLLSDAVRLLEKTIPLVRPPPTPHISALNNPTYIPQHELQTPDHVNQGSISELHGGSSSARNLLPARDEVINSVIRPANSHRKTADVSALGSYDTKLGRFATGVSTSIVLPPSTALPVKEMEDIVAPRNEHLRMRSPIHQQRPLYRTYPDHREGLFPETANQARYERPVANIPARADGTVTESKSWHGTDLLETDRLGSWPMGRFDKEEPQYPTPEPKRDTTIVIAALTPMPAFRPYIGPERFTGSHLAREIYNIRHNGRPRFVKIDLLNE